jgi:hypothetical protein
MDSVSVSVDPSFLGVLLEFGIGEGDKDGSLSNPSYYSSSYSASSLQSLGPCAPFPVRRVRVRKSEGLGEEKVEGGLREGRERTEKATRLSETIYDVRHRHTTRLLLEIRDPPLTCCSSDSF